MVPWSRLVINRFSCESSLDLYRHVISEYLRELMKHLDSFVNIFLWILPKIFNALFIICHVESLEII